jgi:hypothetical protein
LQAAGAQICIGTDSLASNHQLSVMAELLTIKAYYPDISWEIYCVGRHLMVLVHCKWNLLLDK